MRASLPLRVLCGLTVLLATGAAAFNVSVRMAHGPEGEVSRSAFVEANDERVALLVPPGWQARTGAKANSLSLSPSSGESPIAVEFSEQNAAPLLASAAVLRQTVAPFLQEAVLLEEFPAYTGYGPGRGADFAFLLQGHSLRTRLVVIPLARGFVSFQMACPAADAEPHWQMLAATLTSFRRAPAHSAEPLITMQEPLQPEPSERPKAQLATGSAQTVSALYTEPPPPPVVEPEPKPIFAGYENHVRLGVITLLLAALSTYTLARHRRDAEIRALCGGYLSDGTEVASFKMPEWFAVPSAPQVSTAPALDGPDWTPVASGAAPAPDPVQKFLEEAPALLANIRNALRELGRSGHDGEWRTLLAQLPKHFTTLKERTNFWEMRPVWQLSSAVELLAQRVADKPKDATPSTLRTITAATDLLQSLCVPGVRPNLIIDPPLNVLAVDDDPLCLRAVVFALQKAGLASETAADGVQAVALASTKTYDVIFMDIQMPEMDGLTACKKIRETKANAQTPIVFVTIQSDFHTRAQSTLTGGSDLMAKPFLVFELTVKALMASMRKRLETQQSANLPQPIAAPAPAAIRAAITSSLGANRTTTATASAPRPQLKKVEAAPDSNQNFAERSTSALLALQNVLDEVTRATAQGEAKEPLGVFYVQTHAFVADAEKAGFELAALLGSNLERLAKKLYEKPQQANPSTLHTVASALRLLREVCRPGVEQKSADPSRVRMLVVDDEPLARRAITGALQLAFDQPDSAEDGITALALVREKAYDVIFTDVRMPGLDGFALCAQIRKTEQNRQTPVIFVTGLGDDAAREQAALSGGNDFIAKPCLPAEITLKALTFIIRKRLELPVEAGADEVSPTPPVKSAESALVTA